MITLNNSNIDFGFEDESLGSKYSISLSRDTSNLIFRTEDIERMTIMKNGKVGIGKTETTYDLDVNGSINAGSYLINGQDISIITSDTSNYVRETSNMLIGRINDTSNYVRETSNMLIGRINDTCNYVRETSNMFIGRINDTSNYVGITSNILIRQISDISIYIHDTSNMLIKRINDTSNYAWNTSNILIGHINDTSNYVRITSNNLIISINDTSNYMMNTSNILIGRINNTSNYVRITSNNLIVSINNTSNYMINTNDILVSSISDTSNYVRITSNNLISRIIGTSNYMMNTSDILVSSISNTSNYVRTTSNIIVGSQRNSDTSNYVRTTSNIFVNLIKSSISTLPNYSTLWTTNTPNIYYISSNVGIGTYNPVSKLHLYDEVSKTTKLTIQNNKTTVTGTPNSIAFSGGLSSSIIQGTTESLIVFPYALVPYTFTTNEVLICDILLVGGGGGGGPSGINYNNLIDDATIFDTDPLSPYLNKPLVNSYNLGEGSEVLTTDSDFKLQLKYSISNTSGEVLRLQSKFSNIFNKDAIPYSNGDLPFMVFENLNILIIYKNLYTLFNISSVEINIENFLKTDIYIDLLSAGVQDTYKIFDINIYLYRDDTLIGYRQTSFNLIELNSFTIKNIIIDNLYLDSSFINCKLQFEIVVNPDLSSILGATYFSYIVSDILKLETIIMVRNIFFKSITPTGEDKNCGGGGGAGGYVYLTNTILPQGAYTVTVGKGGSGIINGSESKISGPINYIAYGGGYGGDWTYGLTYMRGGEGGSGGGAGFKFDKNYTDYIGGRSLQELLDGYGNGGNGNNVYSNYNIIVAGGGGGARGFTSKGDYNNSNNTIYTGNGVNGLTNSITGVSVTYAGGGGGARNGIISNNGGSGGGGNGAQILNGVLLEAQNGENGKGGGGGGGKVGGTIGGNGVVIIRYKKYQTKLSSMELIIGSATDNNIDYKIGNYDGVLKITSLTLGTPTDRLVINNNGYVGIGTTNPKYRLDIERNSNPSASFTFGIYFDFNTLNIITSKSLTNMCAKFNGSIWITGNCFGTSDIRIKEDIKDINDDSALQKILAIEPKTYTYIDKIENGNKKVYGFIAQQVHKVIPEAVSLENAYIPNIMMLSDYNNEIITLPYIPDKVVIKIKDKIKCFDSNNNLVEIEVSEIINNISFKIKDLEKRYKNNKIFVYGTFVNDFHTLSKEYIYTLNVAATHELYRQIKEQDKTIKSCERINALHKQNKDLNEKYEMLLKEITSIKQGNNR